MQLPLAARLHDSDGAPLWLNGTAFVSGWPEASFAVRRGFGAALQVAPDGGSVLALEARIGGTASPAREVAIETGTAWTDIASGISSDTDWGENARVRILGDITIASGATLTIGKGSVIAIAEDVDIDVDGRLSVDGTVDEPVVIGSAVPGELWGGFFARGTPSIIEVTGALISGAGADSNWFSGSGYSAHRDEQAIFMFSDNSVGTLTDCVLLSGEAQAIHGRNATITLDRCLVRGGPTTGQCNGGAVTVRDSGLIGFPEESGEFADDDNDGIYFTRGNHRLERTVIGWAKDDGVDAGSGSTGSVTVVQCWFEACFHEGMAWSGDGRTISVTDTVAINCGQGLEAGWTEGSAGDINPGDPPSPDVTAVRVVSIGNEVGLRFGDNYDWGYNGFLDVVDSIVLHNEHNIFGIDWTSWEQNLDKMDIRSSWLSEPDPLHPNNAVWSPQNDAARLDPFMAVPGSQVGIGIAEWTRQRDISSAPASTVTAALSSFTSRTVTADYEIAGRRIGRRGEEAIAGGTVIFEPGAIRAPILVPFIDPAQWSMARVSLVGASAGEISGPSTLVFVSGLNPEPGANLIAEHDEWKFSTGADLGAAWREAGYDDSGWASGPAELGYGDSDEETVVPGGPSSARYPTCYFRRAIAIADAAEVGSATMQLRRDDAAIVYVNDAEVYRDSDLLGTGPVAYSDYASGATSSENSLRTATIPGSVFVEGTNTIAVEVHQGNPDSSDLSFAMILDAFPRTEPFFSLENIGGQLVLIWKSDPGTFAQASPDLGGAWTSLQVPSPITVFPPRAALQSGAPPWLSDSPGRMFFRIGLDP